MRVKATGGFCFVGDVGLRPVDTVLEVKGFWE
jgi:hypothetical protein